MSFTKVQLPIGQLALSAVLSSGQSFRWSTFTNAAATAEYRLCLADRVVCLRQTADTLYYCAVFPDAARSDDDGDTLKWLNDYFQLDVDLVALYREWAAKDPVFAACQDRFRGIRVLRQDPWETLISFICSSNNNIPRITKMVHSLCTHYSPPLLSLPHPFNHAESITYHPFPSPSALAAQDVPSRLRALGFGYRSQYIHRTAQMLLNTSSPSLDQLRLSSTPQAREHLLKFVGVGPKVADCILLMSLDKKEVVPVDTHVYQIAVKHYGLKAKATMSPKLYDQVSAKFISLWGEYAGWAHTVLFTADLKSFASYGLPTSSPQKRKVLDSDPCSNDVDSQSTLADRVKKRRRRP